MLSKLKTQRYPKEPGDQASYIRLNEAYRGAREMKPSMSVPAGRPPVKMNRRISQMATAASNDRPGT